MTSHISQSSLLNILKTLIGSKSLPSLVDNFNTALAKEVAQNIMVVGVFDKFENDIVCYTKENETNSEKIKKLFSGFAKSEYSRGQGSLKNVTFSPLIPSSSSFYYGEAYDISDGKKALFYTEFKSKDDLYLFSQFSSYIMPQFWSLFGTHYKTVEKGEETEILWSLRDAEKGLNKSLNNIELNNLLENLLTVALNRTGNFFGAVLLLNESTGELIIEPRAIKGKAHSVLPNKLPANEVSIARIVIKTNRHYICDDTDKDENYYRMFIGVHSSVTVPIKFQNRTIGVIVVESDKLRQFTEETATVLQRLADEATMFIRRAQLYQATLKQDGAGIMIFGHSSEWKDVEKRIEKASRTNATVILRGESGTGKELLAHAIHFNSPRKDAPFVTLNCAAIPGELLESEMFGHTKGSFTGATADKIGEFKKAENGTIFLDEIGDLPLPLQVKILRVLQDGEIRPIGSNLSPEKVDVRVIAATSRPLEQMLKTGEFRMDMYYRLHVVPIHLPPLRNYKEDIPDIIKNFIKEANQKFGTTVKSVSPKTLRLLMNYDYPGNVRQLRNFVQQAVIMADDDTISQEDLPLEMQFVQDEKGLFILPELHSAVLDGNYIEEREKIVATFSRQYFQNLLQKNRGNIKRCAEEAGVSRVALYKILKKYEISQ